MQEKTIIQIRKLIWLYFYLLLFEGALRKWVIPAASGPLLLIRDPVLLAIYVLAFRARVFPRNSFIVFGSVLGLIMLFVGIFVNLSAPGIAVFGFHANFLHLPLIFLIPNVFTLKDVRSMAYSILVISIPMAILCAVQFESSSSAWVNAGAGEGAGQIALVGDKVRAAGTFSYNIGPVNFFPIVTGILLYNNFTTEKFPRWLVVSSVICLFLAVAVSGSRTLILLEVIAVAFAFFYSLMVNPRMAFRSLRLVIPAMFVAVILVQIPIIQEAVGAFSERISNASESEGGNEGIFNTRILGAYFHQFEIMGDVPALGYGLGAGTTVASALRGDAELQFLGESELEWSRHVIESGPILGLLYITFRVSLVAMLFFAALGAARKGNALPLLLFGSNVITLLNGALGQVTELGFAVLTGGLILAACHVPDEVPVQENPYPKNRYLLRV